MSDLEQRMQGVYVVTDPGYGERDHVAIAAAAILGGACCVQLRDKNLHSKQFLEVAETIRNLTIDTKTLFVVNDRIDVAIASKADGIHVGQNDLPADATRMLSGDESIVGISTSCVDEAIKAEAAGADYIGVGPIFPTISKSDAGDAIGLEVLSEIRNAVNIPIVAIGGIYAENIALVAEAGADAAAVISAVAGADDMTEAVRALSKEFNRGKSK